MPGKHKKKKQKSAQAPAPLPSGKPSGNSTVQKSESVQEIKDAVTLAVNAPPKESCSTIPIPSPCPSTSSVSPKLDSPEKNLTMAPTNAFDISSTDEGPVLVAVKELLKVIEDYNGSTVNGLFSELKSAKGKYTENLSEKVPTKSRLAVKSACAQFIQYATLTLSSIETEDLSKCREQMLSEGLKYLRRCQRSIEKISRWAVTLIFDGACILVHSDSLVVLETLRSVPKNIYFSVYIVIDDDSVSKFFEENYNIDVKTIRDAEIATLMEGMDLIMVGAEAVLKNGGIINKVGTLPLAICAREMNKPMYVLAESFKFSLMYPMSQSDLPKEIRENATTKRIRVDYTLPKYITFLVTDRGLLTPTAVCDELIELYT